MGLELRGGVWLEHRLTPMKRRQTGPRYLRGSKRDEGTGAGECFRTFGWLLLRYATLCSQLLSQVSSWKVEAFGPVGFH